MKFVFALIFILSFSVAQAQYLCLPGTGASEVMMVFGAKDDEDACKAVSTDDVAKQCRCFAEKKSKNLISSIASTEADRALQDTTAARKKATADVIESFAMLRYQVSYQQTLALGLKAEEADCTEDKLLLAFGAQLENNSDLKAMKAKTGRDAYDSLKTYLDEKMEKGITPGGLEGSVKAYKDFVDEKIKDNMKNDFGVKNACVTPKEFLALRRLPTKQALESILTWDGSAERLSDSQNKDLVKFLKANPMITKLLAVPGNEEVKKKALKSLKEFARATLTPAANIESGPREYQKNLLSLLKNDFAPELKKLSTSNSSAVSKDSQMCAELGTALAAVQLTDYFPSKNSDQAELLDLPRICRARELAHASGKNLENTLQSNLLLAVNSAPRPSMEQEFQKFVNENCQGYEKFLKEAQLAQCPKGKADCLTDNDKQKIRINFLEYKKDNEMLSIVRDINDLGIGGHYSEEQTKIYEKEMANSKLSNKAKKAYNAFLKKMVDVPVVADYGKEKEFKEVRSQKVAEISKASETSFLPIFERSNIPSTTEADAVANGVITPNWMNDPAANYLPQITSSTIAQGAGALLPKNYSSLSPDEKVKTVEQIQDNLNKFTVSKTESSEVKALQEQLEDMRDELDEAKKTAQKEKEVVESAPTKVAAGTSVSGSSTTGSTQGGHSQSYAPVYSTGGTSGGMQNNTFKPSVSSDLSRGNSSRDSALLAKYAAAADRAPASVKSEMGLLVSSTAESVVPDSLGSVVPMVVSEAQMSAFKGSAEALSKELGLQVDKLGLVPGKNKVIEVKSSSSDKKMYLHAVWKNNEWTFHPFNQEAQVQIAKSRSHTLKGMNAILQSK